MQILSTGGTMSAIEEQPETIVEHLNALWDNQNNRPIPTDIRWEDYAPEKVMLRFKDELKRLQPYVEGWFSERGSISRSASRRIRDTRFGCISNSSPTSTRSSSVGAASTGPCRA